MADQHKTKGQLIIELQKLRGEHNSLKAEYQRDIITHEQAEEKILLEKNFSENILETANVIILALDLNANITIFNKFSEKLTGYKKEEVLWKNWFKLFIPKIGSTLISQAFSDILTNMSESSSYENTILCKNGTERLISWENTVLKNEYGDSSGILSIGTDITERKQTEQALLKLKTAIEKSKISFIITDSNGNIEYANSFFTELTGYLPDEYIGKNSRFFKTNYYRKEFYKELWNTILSGKTWEGEFYNRKKNGEFYWESSIISPILNDKNVITHFVAIKTDITERKKVIETLKESEEKFREMSNLLPQMVYEADINGNVTFANKKAFEIFEYSKEMFDQGINILQLLIPEDIERAKENISNILKGKPIHNVEYTAVKKDGSKIPILSNSNPIVKNNIPVGMRGVIMDITEQTQAEETLRKSEETFRSYVDFAPHGVFVSDKNGNYLDVNHAACKISGYSKEELLLMNLQDLVPQDSVETAMNHFNKIVNEGFASGEIKYIRKDGSKGFWTIDAVKISDDRFLGFVVDISERKQAEEKLRNSEMLLRETQAIAHLGTYVLDISTGFWTSSEILDDIFGIDEHFVRSIEGWGSLIHPGSAAEMIKYITEDVIGKHKKFNKEYKIIRKSDGKELWLHGLGELEFDKNNEPIKLIGTISDITERKQAEEKLRLSEERLRKFMDSATDSFALFDSELNFIDINKAAEANLGLSKKKIVGKNIGFISPNFKETEAYNKYMQVIKTGQSFSDNDDSLDPEFGNQSIKRTVFKVGEGLGIITTDNTKSEKAEEVYWESDIKLKKAAKFDLIGSWEFNLSNSQIQLSESIFKMFEIDPDKFEATYDFFLNTIHPDDLDRVKKAYNESLLNKTPYEITYRLLMPDGRIKWVVEFCRTDYNIKGKALRSIGIVHDITERKQAKR